MEKLHFTLENGHTITTSLHWACRSKETRRRLTMAHYHKALQRSSNSATENLQCPARLAQFDIG